MDRGGLIQNKTHCFLRFGLVLRVYIKVGIFSSDIIPHSLSPLLQARNCSFQEPIPSLYQRLPTMPRPYTPDTARPIYAPGHPAPYYDDTPTPRASEYDQRELLRYQWDMLPNASRPPRLTDYGMLDANAVEFHPSGMPPRPASALSIASSRSSATSSSAGRTSLVSASSSATSATSVSHGQIGSLGGKSPDPIPKHSPLPPVSPIPVFPDVDPGEHTYTVYRERVRRATNMTTPIQSILETAGDYRLTQHMAILAHRLSVHAPCGPEQFIAHLRSEALGLMASYWQDVRSLLIFPTSNLIGFL